MNKILISRPSRYLVNTKKLKSHIKSLLEKHNVQEAEVSLSFVGERKAAQLAKTYLGEKDNPHNVLSFPYWDERKEVKKEFKDAPGGRLQLGDIVICYPIARKEAGEKNKMVDDVILKLAEHGTMHLLGIHHED